MCTVQYLLLKFPDIIRIVCIVVQSIYLRYTMRYMLRAEREILARRRWRQLRRERLQLSWGELSYYTSVSHSLPLCRTRRCYRHKHTHTHTNTSYEFPSPSCLTSPPPHLFAFLLWNEIVSRSNLHEYAKRRRRCLCSCAQGGKWSGGGEWEPLLCSAESLRALQIIATRSLPRCLTCK